MKTYDILKDRQILLASIGRLLSKPKEQKEPVNPYDCDLPNADERITYGKPYTFTNGGNTYNYQPVMVDGKEVSTLEEIQWWALFEDMSVRFIVGLTDEEAKKLRKHPNFRLGYYENPELSFKTLQDLVDYLITYKIIRK